MTAEERTKLIEEIASDRLSDLIDGLVLPEELWGPYGEDLTEEEEEAAALRYNQVVLEMLRKMVKIQESELAG